MRWNDGKRKKESKSSKQPAASQQYIYQYKIQNIVPNTFSNKESIAQEDSLHNQLKNFISYPLIVWGGGEGVGGGFINHFPTLTSIERFCSAPFLNRHLKGKYIEIHLTLVVTPYTEGFLASSFELALPPQ